MRIHLLNPNTNAVMTEQMAQTARQISLPDNEIIATPASAWPRIHRVCAG
ncbi:hypothetical protein P4S72_13925 [Vibrio sp. PP-XX7]